MTPQERHPWTFAAVCFMVLTLTLLMFGLTQVPVIELLPGYVAAYLLIGACIFGPTCKVPALRQAVAFLLPGALFIALALLGFGFWAGGWLLGLPAWGLLLSRWTPGNPHRVGQVLAFLAVLVLGMAIFTFNIICVVFSLGLFLLPVIPLIAWPTPGTVPGRCRRALRSSWPWLPSWWPLSFPPLKGHGARRGFMLVGPPPPG